MLRSEKIVQRPKKNKSKCGLFKIYFRISVNITKSEDKSINFIRLTSLLEFHICIHFQLYLIVLHLCKWTAGSNPAYFSGTKRRPLQSVIFLHFLLVKVCNFYKPQTSKNMNDGGSCQILRSFLVLFLRQELMWKVSFFPVLLLKLLCFRRLRVLLLVISNSRA